MTLILISLKFRYLSCLSLMSPSSTKRCHNKLLTILHSLFAILLRPPFERPHVLCPQINWPHTDVFRLNCLGSRRHWQLNFCLKILSNCFSFYAKANANVFVSVSVWGLWFFQFHTYEFWGIALNSHTQVEKLWGRKNKV